MSYHTHNFAKLKILAGINHLKKEHDKMKKSDDIEDRRNARLPDRKSISRVTGLDEDLLSVHLPRLVKYEYIKKYEYGKPVEKCRTYYLLTKTGLSVYSKLVTRYEQGLTLNLRDKGKQAQYYKVGDNLTHIRKRKKKLNEKLKKVLAELEELERQEAELENQDKSTT